jgi:hypothetical protein
MRRTVAKYRDELNILPSNLRKVYKKYFCAGRYCERRR